MKRCVIAAVAAATAMSLAAAPASAKTSSEVTDAQAGWHVTKAIGKEAIGQDGFGSSIDKAADFASSKAENATSSDVEGLIKEMGNNGGNSDAAGSAAGFLWDTVKADTAHDWKVGTTLDILVGVSIAAVVALLAALGIGGAHAAGLVKIPGLR